MVTVILVFNYHFVLDKFYTWS